jgi:hypothetical protein
MPFLQKSKKEGFMPRKKSIVKPPLQCMLCLESIASKQTYVYTITSCKCNLQLHDKCFEKWNRTYPGSCPTCKKQGTCILNPVGQQPPVQVAVVGMSEDEGWCACILGCWGCMTLLDVFTN